MDETNAKRLPWKLAALERGLIPQPHGGALMPGGGFRLGAGRPKSRVKLALKRAKGDPLRQLEIARQCRDNESLPFSERLHAIYAILKLARLDRQRPRSSKRSTFSVVTASADEQIAKVRDAGPAQPGNTKADPGSHR